jgi:hypothetical protein
LLRIDLRHPRTEFPGPKRGTGNAVLPYALGGLCLLSWVALWLWLAARLGFDDLAVALVAIGVAYAVLSVWRPAWYWNSLALSGLRYRAGDRGTLIASLCFCTLLSAAGIHRQIRLDVVRTQCATLLAGALPGATRNAAYDHRVHLGPTDWLRKSRVSCREILRRMP